MANYAISSLKFNDNNHVFTVPYGSCSTAAATAAKTVSVGNFSLETGAIVAVKFTVTNSASSPTLNVSSTGAKSIYYKGAAITASYLKANYTYQFMYNGTQWDLIGEIDTDTDTIHPTISKSTDTTSTASPEHGLTFTAVDDITRDGYGHVTKINTKTVTLPDAGLHYVDSGNMTVVAGSSTSNAYLAAKWSIANVDGITAPTDGMSISLRTPAVGYSGGILLSIDGGTTYYPIVRNVDTLVTTNYAAGSTLILTFNPKQTAAPYTSAGTTTTITGCWQIADYDSNTTYTNVKLGHGCCTCDTAAATQAKTANLSGYTLTTGGIVAVKFTNGITVASPTLNINSKGAKAIYYRGAALTDTSLIQAGDTVTFIYSSYYHIISIDRAPYTHPTYTAKSSGLYKVTVDGTGHVSDAIAVTKSDITALGIPGSDTNTHYSTGITAGASGTITNSATSNPYIKVKDDSTHRAQIQIKGSGATSVSSDANGVITISSTDNNTTYTFNGAVSTIKDSNLTDSRALISNGSGKVAVSDVTSTELGYLDGVTSNIQTQLNGKLEKLQYEWNKSYNAGGTAGYLLIGSFPMYDSNVTIDIDSTTSTTYHGTVVIATQNVSTTSIGSAHTITVYGDATGTISDAIRVVWTSGSRNYNVYFVPATWSKNLIHIRALGQYLDETDTTKICTQFTAGTAPATTSGLTVINALTSNFSSKSHAHTVTHTPAGTNAKTSLTPAGTVSTPTITVTPNTTTVNSITAVGTLPSLTYEEVAGDNITAWSAGSGSASLTGSVSTGPNRIVTLTLSHTHTAPSLTYSEVKASKITGWSAGSLPTKGSNTTVVTGIKSATSTQPTFTGTAAEHTHTFTGTAATINTSAANS